MYRKSHWEPYRNYYRDDNDGIAEGAELKYYEN